MNYLKAPVRLKDKKVLIMGLGTKDGGTGAALWAAKQGAKITITDMKDERYLKESLSKLKDIQINLNLGQHDRDDFISNDIVIKNPGIKRENPYLRIAEKHGKIIDSPEGIFSEIVLKPYIGVTGTKGKSSTTHIIEKLLVNMGIKTKAAGNNCISPLRFMGNEQPTFVMELSSWQLSEMALHRKSPHLACWLNFFPDHLKYYNTRQEYWLDKYNITKFQDQQDFIVLPFNTKQLSNIKTDAQKIFFSSAANIIDNHPHVKGCFIHKNIVVIKTGNDLIELMPLPDLSPLFQVPHYLNLLLAAISCVYFFVDNKIFASKINSIKQALKFIEGLPHRFEYIFSEKNIDIINDSAATTPQSVVLAIDAVKKEPLILIFGGGDDKNLSFEELAEKIIAKVKLIILFENDQPSDKIYSLLSKHKFSKDKIIMVKNMGEAVTTGGGFLFEKGAGTLLLSSGCSGYPFFQDLFVRGDLFKKCVNQFLLKNFSATRTE